MGMNVLPSDSYSELSLKIRRAVEEHFRNDLRRPELLNRIGQNVVAFDFLKPDGMAAIFATILEKVIKTVELEHAINVSLSDTARTMLRQVCTQDYFDGGRGIANRIETHFINPLARQLFLTGSVKDIRITGVDLHDDKTTLAIEDVPSASARADTAGSVSNDPTIQKPARPKHPILSNDRWRKRLDEA